MNVSSPSSPRRSRSPPAELAVAVLERLVVRRHGGLRRRTRHELGVGLHDVIALEERLLGHLPVGVEDDLLPPLHPHIVDPDAVEHARPTGRAPHASGRASRSMLIHTHPAPGSTWHSRRRRSSGCMHSASNCSLVRRTSWCHRGSTASRGTGRRSAPRATSRPLARLCGPMPAGVVERLYRAVGLAHDQDRLSRSRIRRSHPARGSPPADTPSATPAARAASPTRRRPIEYRSRGT